MALFILCAGNIHRRQADTLELLVAWWPVALDIQQQRTALSRNPSHGLRRDEGLADLQHLAASLAGTDRLSSWYNTLQHESTVDERKYRTLLAIEMQSRCDKRTGAESLHIIYDWERAGTKRATTVYGWKENKKHRKHTCRYGA